MNISRKNYKKYVEAHAPRSPHGANLRRAFVVGGAICALGQAMNMIWSSLGIGAEDGALLTSVVLVFASAILTSLGCFDVAAKYAGGGTLVPITGFANSVVSAAIDSKDEGFVLGLGAKIFTVAGPVLLYGTLAGTVYGFVYWLCLVL